MFIPFLAAVILAATFSSVGAMSVKISMLILGLEVLGVVVVLLAIYVLYRRGQQSRS